MEQACAPFVRSQAVWECLTVIAMALLSYSLNQVNARATKTAVILHGILGNKSNWRSFSFKLLTYFPDWRILTVDHRGHGDSPSFKSPHSVESCGLDLKNLLTSLKITPSVLCGHSFGGKVALSYLEKCKESQLPLPKDTWILDSLPGNKQNDYAVRNAIFSSVETILPKLKAVKMPVHSKSALVDELLKQKVSHMEAQWMTTNLKLLQKDPELYSWKMNLSIIDSLFNSFLETDCWQIVESIPTKDVKLHFVRAGKNKMWKNDTIERMKKICEKSRNVSFHTMEKSDHWLHIDDPLGLLNILTPSFK